MCVPYLPLCRKYSFGSCVMHLLAEKVLSDRLMLVSVKLRFDVHQGSCRHQPLGVTRRRRFIFVHMTLVIDRLPQAKICRNRPASHALPSDLVSPLPGRVLTHLRCDAPSLLLDLSRLPRVTASTSSFIRYHHVESSPLTVINLPLTIDGTALSPGSFDTGKQG
jgi:hypothetical protein